MNQTVSDSPLGSSPLGSDGPLGPSPLGSVGVLGPNLREHTHSESMAFEDSPPTSPVKKTRIQQYRIKDIQSEATIIVDAILVQGRVHFHTGYSSSYQEFF